MNTYTYEKRRETLRALLRARGLDALLVSHAANRFYLSGFELLDGQCNESSGRLLIGAHGRDWLCTDARFFEAARRLWDEDHIVVCQGDAFAQIGALIKDKVRGVTGFEAKTVCCHGAQRLGLRLLAADGLVESLRMIKDAGEIAALERSCGLNHKLMEQLPSLLHPGCSEAELAWNIERFFRENGAAELAFPTIAARGPNAALPHYEPSARTLLDEECPVLIDCGARLDRYCSDQTRTFWLGGTPAPEFTCTLELVRGAQDAAIQGIRPGMSGAEIYALAFAFFERHGVEKAFTHGLGHGIGLETHEGPSLNPRNPEPVPPGAVFTVEPGLYYPEWGGVRWEYMLVMEEDGARIL
ncbi:MAG: aminopeptidase P family protein [Deltaproteobacteria bacterium]|jgi:Xaa-Pro aminopeptidase|nr:aminopeptidase P family protein [Deltaproteobacteria bacterium]